MNRRRFLGLAGLSALGLGACRALGPVMSGAEADADAARAAAAGTRWAMLVDMARCRELPGCTRCVVACHERHNVPATDDEARAVKWIWKERYGRAFASDENAYVEAGLAEASLPVLCNHCDRPPCVRVCPTQATWKRDDGVVMMDWHRCIG
jgi:molybdopterin-containing oxidoreductase family iron-sulfur binding subunit